jgi:hypothetical protein
MVQYRIVPGAVKACGEEGVIAAWTRRLNEIATVGCDAAGFPHFPFL